jgi:nucleoid-associated protein YgaU
MGLFDKMFGRGASDDEKAQKRFQELSGKYQSVLNLADQQQVQFQNLHVEDNKLYIRAVAPSQDIANRLWDQIKLTNPNLDDISADISVRENMASSAVTSASPTATPTAASPAQGDTLSKISRQHYGDANEYMRIFYANRDQITDPNKIRVGQKLVIPADTDD